MVTRTVTPMTKKEVRVRYGLAKHGLPQPGSHAVLAENWETGEREYLIVDEVEGCYLHVHEAGE